jgi:electron transfer flavoprotein alpha subunit
MAENKSVLIIGEINGGKIAGVSLELITTGKKLIEKGKGVLELLLMGEKMADAAETALSYGLDKVYTVEGVLPPGISPEDTVTVMAGVSEKVKPSVILFSHTDFGRDAAPRLAARLKVPVRMDCIKLEIDSETGKILQHKPVYGGNAVAVWEASDHKPIVISMRPRAKEPAVSQEPVLGEIIPLSVNVGDSEVKGKILRTVKEDIEGIKLEEAKTIVAGGGGIGGKEGFEKIRELARILGGAVGVSRVPCDENWMPSSLEVGQTGHVVSPDLYIAVGISGAPQHLAGCSGAKCIVAINKDPEAHIFREADFGIVGDYKEALPAFIEKCKEIMGK